MTIENVVYVVQNIEGDILGIYEEVIDAVARQEELEADGMETILDDYILNVDVELIDREDAEPTTIYNDNVVEFKQ